MTELHLPNDRLAQAIYTWSLTNVDGTRGMGFSAISPALTGSIDWLQRFPSTAFRLFPEDAGEVTSDLYEARRGFSETGRLFERGIGVVYCKTADGAVDAMGRPQPVVHALFGDAGVLGLDVTTQIAEEFWITDVERIKQDLKDYAISDLPAITEVPQHLCPIDHEGARIILHLIADIGQTRNVILECPSSERILPEVLLAVPSGLARTASLTPYASLEGVVRQLHLTAHALSRVNPRVSASAAMLGRCEFARAVESAAQKYIYVRDPDLKSFAVAALEATAPRSGSQGTIKRKREAPASHDRSQSAVAHEIELIKRESGFSHLSEKEGLLVAERLRIRGLPVAGILEEPDEMLLEMFKPVQSEDAVRDWCLLLKELPLNTFVGLWNRTRIAVFLGLVLMRLCSSDGSFDDALVASNGVSPEATASILRVMSLYEGGGLSIATAINNGLGSSELMREFICEAFCDNAPFLYDDILAKVNASPLLRLDYIRFGYSAWARHRRLPENEVAALDQVIRPGLLTRFRILIGRL
jgi:hypothetical protein